VDADQAFELGEGITQYDVDAFGISLAGRSVLRYLRAGKQARHFVVLSWSQSVISGISNQNSHSIQEHALKFAHVVNLSLMAFADVSISVEWTPVDTRLGGYYQALFQVQQECAQLSAEQEETRNVISATYQKEKTCAKVYEQWASEWHTKPRTSAAYRLSLLSLPNGNNHLLPSEDCQPQIGD
jgi:hypothetical protein